MRVPYMRRERAAYIKLRRKGLSINQIAEAFGRSTSCIYRTTKNAESLKTLRVFDLRKLPAYIRRRTASLQHQTMMKLLPKWEAWILGDEEKPP